MFIGIFLQLSALFTILLHGKPIFKKLVLKYAIFLFLLCDQQINGIHLQWPVNYSININCKLALFREFFLDIFKNVFLKQALDFACFRLISWIRRRIKVSRGHKCEMRILNKNFLRVKTTCQCIYSVQICESFNNVIIFFFS